jgi:acyl carrier protein
MKTSDILNFLKKSHSIETEEIDEHDGLFSEGILDSLAIVELVAFIESTAQIRIAPTELHLENLDSIERILRFVESKRTSDG